MRTAIAKVIVFFAKLATCFLSPFRRKDTNAIVRSLMADTWSANTSRGNIQFYIDSRWDLRRALELTRKDESDTLSWIESFPDGACFWDIGANVGLFSLYAAVSGTVRTVAFEPAANTFAVLTRNIELNRMHSRVSTFCIALSNKTRIDTLNMSSIASGGVFNGFGVRLNQFGEEIETRMQQSCIGFSIDDFVDIFSPPLPTHVKIDVDGIEPDILRGGRKLLSGPSVRSVVVEVEGNASRNREIVVLMEEMGFKARPRLSPGSRNIVFDRAKP